MAEYLLIASVETETSKVGPDAGTIVIHASAVDTGTVVDAEWFNGNAIEIEPGTGPALKGVCALALMGALQGKGPPVPYAANDEPSAAERGEFTDGMVMAVARIAYNTVREWKKYEGLLHHPPFDETSDLQVNMACTRVRNIVEAKRYPLDIANKAAVFEDQMYRIVAAAVLAE